MGGGNGSSVVVYRGSGRNLGFARHVARTSDNYKYGLFCDSEKKMFLQQTTPSSNLVSLAYVLVGTTPKAFFHLEYPQ